MSTQITYTSTITVPVYVGWKCEKCGQTNISFGTIACKRFKTTSSWRSSIQKETKEAVSKQAQNEWLDEAFTLINKPDDSWSAIYNNLHLENANCTNCRKRPRWDRSPKLLPFIGLIIMAIIICGLVALASPKSVVGWLLLAVSIGLLVWIFIGETVYIKRMEKLPKEFSPVIGSTNLELSAYAEAQNETIPSQDEVIQTLNNYGMNSSLNNTDDSATVEEKCHNGAMPSVVETVYYCRKCGAKLPDGSDFCNKCGMRQIRETL
ncbi:MAG: zinc ribbon domain-containing protein [Clostridia bacterium]|nr:zinc ribbon domain-containing protein [Clostridia bacterium]